MVEKGEYQSIKLKKQTYRQLKEIKDTLNLNYEELFNLFFSLVKNDKELSEKLKEKLEEKEDKEKYAKFSYELAKIKNKGRIIKRAKNLVEIIRKKKYSEEDLISYIIEMKLIKKYFKDFDLINEYYNEFFNYLNQNYDIDKLKLLYDKYKNVFTEVEL